MFYFLFTNFT